MCVIIAKRKGDNIDRAYLEHMMIRGANSNRDGCGFALKKAGSGEIIFSKGYQGRTAAEDLIDFLKNYEIEQDDEFMFHARIGTSGRRDAYNTHPFVLGESATESDDDSITLKDLHLKQPCFAHNGVFSEYSDYNSRWNDTFHFGDLFLSQPDVVENIVRLDEHSIEVLYKSDFNYNKVSIMFPGNTQLKLVGNFSTDKKGLWYSNRMWEYDDSYRNVGGVETFGSNKTLRDIARNLDSCSLPIKTTKLLTESSSEEGSFDANIELIFEEEEKATPNSGRNFSWEEEDKKKEQKSLQETVTSNAGIYLDIKFNIFNCRELFMMAKDTVSHIVKNRIYSVNVLGQSDGTYWIREFGNDMVSLYKDEDFINANFYFLPKESTRLKYRDYKYLCFKMSPAKNRAKNVKKILTKALLKNYDTCNVKGLMTVRTDALIEFYNQKLLPLLKNEAPILVIDEVKYPFVED